MKSFQIPFLFSLIVGILMLCVWSLVELPYSNPEGFAGPLTEIGFNPANNILRFLLVVFCPSLFLVLLHVANIYKLGPIQELTEPAREEKSFFHHLLFWVGMVFIALWALVGFVVYFTSPFSAHPLDIFHEGEHLTPAFNYWVTGELWSKSFFVHGLFYDCLCDVLAWKLFHVVSIGASRFMIGLWTALIPLCFAIFLISIAVSLRKEESVIGSIFITLAVIIVGFVTLRLQLHILDRRDCLVLLVAACFPLYLAYEKKWLLCTAAFLSALQWFVTIDRAMYVLVGICGVLVIDGLWGGEYKKMASRLGWFLIVYAGTLLAVFGFLGIREFQAFMDNLIYFIRYKDCFDSYVYTSPLMATDHLLYVTPIIGIGLQWLILVRFAFCKGFRNSIAYRMGLLLSLLALVYFRSALGRSDSTHVMYATTFAYLGISYWMAILWLYFAPRLVPYAAIFLVCLMGVWAGREAWALGNTWESFGSAPKQIREFVSLSDDSFLAEKEKRVYSGLQTIFKNEKSIFVYTSEAAWPYLLRKLSHTKYYVVWFASARSRQREIIKDLQQCCPQYILFQSDSDMNYIDGITNDKRFPELHAYLEQNYIPFTCIDAYVIYQSKTRMDAQSVNIQ